MCVSKCRQGENTSKTAKAHTLQVNPTSAGLPLQKIIITSQERPLQDCCVLMLSLIPPDSAPPPWGLVLQRVSGLCLET